MLLFLIAGQIVPLAATRIYQLAFITGFGVSTIIYLALNYFWPPVGKEVSDHFEEIDHTDWELGGRPDREYSDSGSAIEVDGGRANGDSDDGYDKKVV